MKKLPVILLMATLPATAWARIIWTNGGSTQWDLPANWGGTLPTGGTEDVRIQGYITDLPYWPVIDSSIISTSYGVVAIRGPGLHLTQTGGTHEWNNGSGRSSRGLSIYSRPVEYITQTVPPYNTNDAAHPAVVRMTGGTMITDAVGLGNRGGLNGGSVQSVGGDYTQDTGAYQNWQLAEGDDRYGWGRLQIMGDATFIVRPNQYVYPTGYEETNNPYWVYYATNAPTADYPTRVYDVGIGTNSQLVISDRGKLIAPLPIYIGDVDLPTQLQYYQGKGRLVAGPGQTLQYDSFPGTNDVGEAWGGYFTVTAVPPPVVLRTLSAGSLALEGLVGRVYQIESTGDLNSPINWEVRTNFTLTASPQTWNDPTSSSTNRFYRAVLLPLP